MMKLKIAAAALAALVAVPAIAADTWVGSATYTVGSVTETINNFNTYDFSSAGVLLLDTTVGSLNANGYYQSFVTQHLFDDQLINNPQLSAGNYEITVVANFNSTATSGNTYAVNSGSFSLWLGSKDRNFATDTGFANGTKIMEGTVMSGVGSSVTVGAQQFGGGALQLAITGYDSAIYNPDTIGGGDSIFTLRLNAAVDNGFLNPITQVQGHSFGAGDLKYAADGNLILTAVPEPESYAMLLAGIGLIGAIARRRSAR